MVWTYIGTPSSTITNNATNGYSYKFHETTKFFNDYHTIRLINATEQDEGNYTCSLDKENSTDYTCERFLIISGEYKIYKNLWTTDMHLMYS